MHVNSGKIMNHTRKFCTGFGSILMWMVFKISNGDLIFNTRDTLYKILYINLHLLYFKARFSVSVLLSCLLLQDENDQDQHQVYHVPLKPGASAIRIMHKY